MVFDSVYEMFDPLEDKQGNRFWDWFSGKSLDSRWVTHNTGTGSGDFDMTDDGLRITSTDNGATTMDWSDANPPPTRPYSNTGSVMIVVSKLTQAQYAIQYCQLRTNHYTEAGEYVGWNTQGVTNGNASDNKIKLITNSGGGNVDTSLGSGVLYDWHVYKLTVGNGTSTLSVDGVTSGTGFASTSSNPDAILQPAIVSSASEGSVTDGAVNHFRYMECYNT
tara:strand:- start:7 stop:669 length:663 start_codon:yes stop_codon:yes gene_type:complete